MSEPWRLAEPLVAAGVDAAWLDRVADLAGPATDAAIAWVAATLTARGLAGELQESTQRMSDAGRRREDLRLHGSRRPASSSICTRASRRRWRCSATGSSTRTSRSSAIYDTHAAEADRPRLASSTRCGRTCSTTRSTRWASGGRSRSPPVRRQRRARRHRGRRPGHRGRDPRARLRLVLHHQGRRAGHRPRARHRPPHSRRPPRRHAHARLGAGATTFHVWLPLIQS